MKFKDVIITIMTGCFSTPHYTPNNAKLIQQIIIAIAYSAIAIILYGFYRPGTYIYQFFGVTVFRDDVVFHHFSAVEIIDTIAQIVLGSLPLSLGLTGGCLWFFVIWGDRIQAYYYSIALITIFIGSELGQALGIVPGVFDVLDLFFLVIVPVISLRFFSC